MGRGLAVAVFSPPHSMAAPIFFLTFIAACAPALATASVDETGTTANGQGDNNSAQKAIDFMKQFGYLENHHGGAETETLYSGEAISSALRRVQSYGGIPQTGALDDKTLELMTSPRCGVPDNAVQSGRRKRFSVLSGWKKRSITYFIANWTPQLQPNDVKRELRAAFDAWSKNSELKFTEVNSMNADIIILFQTGDHGDGYKFDGPGGILAHAFFPSDTTGGLEGDMHFDDDEVWKVHLKPNDDGIDFFSVAVHELGHSLGLSHSAEQGAVMNPYYRLYDKARFSLGYDDILALYQLYIANGNLPHDDGASGNRPSQTPRPQTTTTFTRPRVRQHRTTTTTERMTTPYYLNPGPRYWPATVQPTEREEPEAFPPPYQPRPGERPKLTFTGDDESVETHMRHDPYHTMPEKVGPFFTCRKDVPTSPPDFCAGDFDAISNLRRELFIFKQGYVQRLMEPGRPYSGYPIPIDRFFRSNGRGEGVSCIDSVYERRNDSNFVIFSGPVYWVYNGMEFIENSPQPITNYGLPSDVIRVDAAMVWQPNGKTYLFSGDSYWRHDDAPRRAMDEGYPKKVRPYFRGVPAPPDAAMTWTDGLTYFFKGKEFWRFNNTWKKTEKEYPMSATAFWLGCKN